MTPKFVVEYQVNYQLNKTMDAETKSGILKLIKEISRLSSYSDNGTEYKENQEWRAFMKLYRKNDKSGTFYANGKRGKYQNRYGYAA